MAVEEEEAFHHVPGVPISLEAVSTDCAIENGCCRDCTGLIWTRNVSFYAEFSQNLDWKILFEKILITATPRVRDWKWQILTRQVWPNCFPMVFPRYFIRVWLNSKTKIFQKQKDEKASKLNHYSVTWSFSMLWKKVLKIFLKKLLILDIRSCLHTQLNQNMKYEVTIGETVVVRYISSVFVALSLWKTSPVGEIWVEIPTTHILSSAGSKIAHEWGTSDCLIVWFIIIKFFFFTLSPWFATYRSFLTQKNDSGWKPRQFWAKMANFSQEPIGSPFQNIFKPKFFQSTFWLNSAYNAIFGV